LKGYDEQQPSNGRENTDVATAIHKHTDHFALLHFCQVQLGEPLTGIDVVLFYFSKLVNTARV
jgi:hypothetical protein